jgi:hypothetical protein
MFSWFKSKKDTNHEQSPNNDPTQLAQDVASRFWDDLSAATQGAYGPVRSAYLQELEKEISTAFSSTEISPADVASIRYNRFGDEVVELEADMKRQLTGYIYKNYGFVMDNSATRDIFVDAIDQHIRDFIMAIRSDAREVYNNHHSALIHADSAWRAVNPEKAAIMDEAKKKAIEDLAQSGSGNPGSV